jgi:UDP-N-acetylmuramyl pentapeptide synthase
MEVLLVGNETREIAKAIKQSGAKIKCHEVASVKDAIERESLFGPEVWCLVKGSRGVSLDMLVNHLQKSRVHV